MEDLAEVESRLIDCFGFVGVFSASDVKPFRVLYLPILSPNTSLCLGSDSSSGFENAANFSESASCSGLDSSCFANMLFDLRSDLLGFDLASSSSYLICCSSPSTSSDK